MNFTYGNLYYQSITDYPVQVYAILTRLKLFFASNIFTETLLADAINRIIVADIINGASDSAIDFSIQAFQSSNPVFPFAAYSYDITEMGTAKDSHLQKSGKYYDSVLQHYVSSKTLKILVPYIFFFNNPKDYYNAQKILHTIRCTPTKIDVPVLINSTIYSFSVKLNLSIERGSFSSNFQEMLKNGAIFDLGVNVECEFNDLTMSGLNLFPVDDMIATLYQMNDEDDSLNVQTGQAYAPSTPAITSSIPLNNAVGVSKSTTITINFTAVMDAASVVDALEIVPYFQHTIEWNDAGTQIIISPINALTGLTLYNIIIHDTAKGFVNDEHPIEDMSIFFTTIV